MPALLDPAQRRLDVAGAQPHQGVEVVHLLDVARQLGQAGAAPGLDAVVALDDLEPAVRERPDDGRGALVEAAVEPDLRLDAGDRLLGERQARIERVRDELLQSQVGDAHSRSPKKPGKKCEGRIQSLMSITCPLKLSLMTTVRW